MNQNNKRIAKNTIIMYFRMFIVTIVTLITVRFVMQCLGVEDYGIYNVVAGVVTSMSFISMSMQMATLRFYAFAIGEKNTEKQKLIFNTSILIYFVIAVIIIGLTETIGLWFLKNKMIIPEKRLVAALWVYHFAILSFIVTMLATPFSIMIIAHENVEMYAVISLIDCGLKFLILAPVAFFSFDKLIMYGCFILLVAFIKENINVIYCRKHYIECSLEKVWDRKQFCSILSYSGWSLFGTSAYVAYNQGNNILINMFFGTMANAAQAVAFQVSNASNMFVSNFFTVVRPPLIKSYVEKNYEYMMQLFYMSSKITYCMVFLIFLPLILQTEYILNIWLYNVSEYMVVFTRLTLIATLILSLHNPITTIIQATGKVKKYHSIVEPIALLILPLTYLFYKLGYAVEYTFYISIVLFIIAHIVRLFVLKSVINFSLKDYCKKFVLPATAVTLFSGAITFYIYSLFSYGLHNFVCTFCVSVLLVLVASFLFMFNKQERLQIVNIAKHKNK